MSLTAFARSAGRRISAACPASPARGGVRLGLA
jgi:hypothetical protein